MRGPLDKAIEASLSTTPSAPALREVEAVKPKRPPGGKALLRRHMLLESAGYLDLARGALEAAVSEENRGELYAFVDKYAPVAPVAGEVGPETPSGHKKREGTKGHGKGESSAAEASEEVGKLYLEAAARLAPSPTGPEWRSLGPWTVPNGQTYGSDRINVSGRIAAIEVDPRNPAHVLAGSANGGVWESFDRGESWAPRTDYAPTLAVGALVFDPNDSSVVYCGTGEGNAWWWLGAGILRSADGGTNWTTLCTTPFVGQGFYALVVDKGNSQRLLAGTTAGLFVSLDGGVNWLPRHGAQTWGISMAPSGAAAGILAACADGLWQSADSGTSWNPVALPGAPGSFDRLAVSVAPSNPAVAYAWGARGGTAYLWRRAAGSWSAVALPPGVSTGQAWYDWFVAAAPDRDTQVYCGAIEAYRGDLSGTTWSWTTISNKSSTGGSIHPDQHAIAFEPGKPDTIYVGNDGGLYRSTDRGITWQHCNNGLVISEFEYLAQSFATSRFIVGGTQDNGTERWTGSAVWDHIADGDGGDCGVNRDNPDVVFHTYYNMSPERSNNAGNWGSWTWLAPPVPSGESSLFYPPFECSATTGNTIAMGSGAAVYLSRNNGSAWTRVALPTGVTASAMYIPNSDRVYVGGTDGRILQIDWSGSVWSAPSTLTTPRGGAYTSDLYADPANLQRLWVTHRTVGGGRVFRSDNGGTSWTDCSAGLPMLPVNAIEIDPSNPDRIWVAADLGVYESLDCGATWSTFSNALPNCYVGDLAFHPHARVLRAGTRNRGVWEIPVDGWMTQPWCGVQFTGDLAAHETKRFYTYNWPGTWNVVWTVMPVTPSPDGPQLSWSVQVQRANAEYVTYWITVTNQSATPISFESRYSILSLY